MGLGTEPKGKRMDEKIKHLRFFANGTCSTNTITQLEDGSEIEFATSHVGLIDGRIVADKNKNYKFATPEEALEAALQFRQHARDAVKKLQRAAA